MGTSALSRSPDSVDIWVQVSRWFNKTLDSRFIPIDGYHPDYFLKYIYYDRYRDLTKKIDEIAMQVLEIEMPADNCYASVRQIKKSHEQEEKIKEIAKPLYEELANLKKLQKYANNLKRELQDQEEKAENFRDNLPIGLH